MKRFCILLLTVLPILLSAQTAKKAFKKLEKNEFSTAKVIFDNMVSSKEDIAIAEYGLALIFEHDSYMNTDLFKAWKYAFDAHTHYKDIAVENRSKYVSYVTDEKLTLASQRIDKALFNYVQSNNTLELTKRFVQDCNESQYKSDGIILLHKQAYKQAVSYNNVLAFREFINTYPKAQQVKQAQEHIYTLEWEKAVQQNTTLAYNKYIKAYPKSKQKAVAEDKIRDIEYKKVMLIGTSDAFEDFIASYSGSKQAEKVNQHWEEQLYSQCLSMNILVLHNRFLAHFPNSSHAQKIKEMRDSLAYEDAKALNTSAAYGQFILDYPDAKQVAEVIALQAEFNFSAHELNLMKDRQKIRFQKLISCEVMHVMANDTATIRLFEKKVYDQHGNVYDVNSYPALDKHYVTSNRYNEKGDLRLSREYKHGNSVTNSVMFKYDDKNLCVEETHKCIAVGCQGNTIDEKHLLSYDEKRNLVKRVVSANDTILYTVTYDYDRNGNVLLETYLGDKAPDVIKVLYQYDFYGNLLQLTHMAKNDRIHKVLSFTYDKQSRLLTANGYDKVGKIRKKYSYNSKNQIEKVSVTFPDKPASTYHLIYTYINL